ncbi:hypothetical protein [Melissococcus plutonius]|uniref:hypothetical protein n=1 Tax=Melissococcus plutonius TaxID=33970 RepID=UPI003C2F4D1A
MRNKSRSYPLLALADFVTGLDSNYSFLAIMNKDKCGFCHDSTCFFIISDFITSSKVSL